MAAIELLFGETTTLKPNLEDTNFALKIRNAKPSIPDEPPVRRKERDIPFPFPQRVPASPEPGLPEKEPIRTPTKVPV